MPPHIHTDCALLHIVLIHNIHHQTSTQMLAQTWVFSLSHARCQSPHKPLSTNKQHWYVMPLAIRMWNIQTQSACSHGHTTSVPGADCKPPLLMQSKGYIAPITQAISYQTTCCSKGYHSASDGTPTNASTGTSQGRIQPNLPTHFAPFLPPPVLGQSHWRNHLHEPMTTKSP